MINIYRMVLRLMQLMQNPHFPSYLRRRTEDRQTKCLFIYGLRARESEQYPTGTNHLYRFRVNPLIATQGILHRIPMFRKSRRVQDNQVISLALRFLFA